MELGLYEPVKKGGMGPENTYNRGSLQVDNIYVSPLLRQFEFEVIPTTEGVCGADHKALIFQIPRQALGIGQLPQQKYKGRQLKIQDPRIQDRYLKEYKHQCFQQKIFKQTKELWDQITPGKPLTISQQEEYEEIDRLKTLTMQRAEKQCRKLKMGALTGPHNLHWAEHALHCGRQW